MLYLEKIDAGYTPAGLTLENTAVLATQMYTCRRVEWAFYLSVTSGSAYLFL